MWIYTTPADAQNKVNVICLCLLYNFMPIKNKIWWLYKFSILGAQNCSPD